MNNLLMMLLTIFLILQIFGVILTILCYAKVDENEDYYVSKIIFIPFLTASTYSADLTFVGKILLIISDIVFLPAHLFCALFSFCLNGIYSLCVRNIPETNIDDWD